MKKFRGIKLGRKFITVFKWINTRPGPTGKTQEKFILLSKFCSFLRRGTKGLLCGSNSGSGHIKLGQEKRVGVPKGHLALYVGESGDETRRVVVPVIYFNHPLFGELLKEAEHVYGFDHSGGITIPCRVSEFEKVQTRIAAWDHCRRKQSRRYLL